MLLYLEFASISFVVFAISRFIPLYCYNIKESQKHVYVRIGEEVTILLYGLFVVFYLFNFFIDYNFLLDGYLDKNVGDAYDEFIQSLEPFLLWNLWYFTMLFCISFYPPVKEGDFYELIAHHVTTVALISAAFYCSWLGVSVWVILINAIFDIFLSLSRIAYKLDHWSQVPLFGIAIITHFILRVQLFPFKILLTILHTPHIEGSVLFYPPFLFTVPLWLLYLYWGWCMLRVCYLRLWKGKYDVDYSDGEQKPSIGQKTKKEK